MNTVDNLSDDANQLTRAVLSDGSLLTMQLIYRPATQRWTISAAWPGAAAAAAPITFTVNGINLCVGANLLREWRNLIPFGLACVTTDGADPFDIEDFVSGRAALYVLDAAEVQGVETNVYGGLT